MWLAALHHTEMVEKLAAFQAAVSSTVQFMLIHLPTETLQVDVVDELATTFRKQEE
jgi:hypothetical protein